MTMQDIKSIIDIGNKTVFSGDLQTAIGYYDTAYSESSKINYIGGIFCSSRRLGDKNCEYSYGWYNIAMQSVETIVVKDTIIKESLVDMYNHIISLCSMNDEWKTLIPAYQDKIISLKAKVDEESVPLISEGVKQDTNTMSDIPIDFMQDYDTVVKKQESETKNYESFFNSCRKNSLRTVLRSIHKGIDVNHINLQTMYTALHNACWRGHTDIVCALLRHGADMSILNGEGEDCIQCATIAKKQVIVDLLLRVKNEGVECLGKCAECERMAKK